MNQQPRTEARRERRPHGLPLTPRRTGAASIKLAWTPSSHDQAPHVAPTELELFAALESSPMAPWTSRENLPASWLETLASARCSEVTLTARLDDDQNAKHRVLELVELLTFELAATQPLIRVRFLPTASGRRRARNPA